MRRRHYFRIVCPWVRFGARPERIVRTIYLTNQSTKFHQALADGVVEAADELIRFWRSRVQSRGRYKVRYENLRNPYLLNGLKDFEHILQLYKHSVPLLDELITFWRSWDQDQVSTRSSIWVSYCSGWRHPYRRLGVEVSSRLHFEISCEIKDYTL